MQKICGGCLCEFLRPCGLSDVQWASRKYCSKTCASKHRFGTLSERLENNFMPEPTSGCWIWTAGTNQYGYGLMNYKGRKQLAHRLSYQEYIGPISRGMWALHKCDNTYCINPSHLYEGTPAQNTADSVARGRIKTGVDSPNYVHGRGII